MADNQVSSLGIFAQVANLIGDVKLEPGTDINLSYDFTHNSIIISKAAAPKLFPGLIGSQMIDWYAYAATSDGFHSLLKRLNNIVAFAGGAPGGSGRVMTVEVLPSGKITKSVIDFYQYDNGLARDNRLIQIEGDTHCVVWYSSDSKGKMITLSIEGNGIVGNAPLNSKTYFNGTARNPFIFKVGPDRYGIMYLDGSLVVNLQTRYIGTDGLIGDVVIDSKSFGAVAYNPPLVVPLAGEYYAVCYKSAAGKLVLRTFRVRESGFIEDTLIDSKVYELCQFTNIDFKKIGPGVYAVPYTVTEKKGRIYTYAISDAGVITAAPIDMLEFDTDSWDWYKLTHIGEKVYSITYCRGANELKIVTVTITSAGEISNAIIAACTVDPGSCSYTACIQQHPNLQTFIYRAPPWIPRLATIYIDP